MPRRTPLLAALLLVLVSLPAFAAEPFTLVYMPDTQCYADLRQLDAERRFGKADYAKYFHDQTEWIRDKKGELAIHAMVHGGDIVQTDFDGEWEIAHAALTKLDGHVPYCLNLGNHDMGCLPGNQPYRFSYANTRETNFPKYFPKSKYENLPWFGGSMDETLANAWYKIDAGDYKFMIVCLEFKPRDEALEWANGVIAANPDRRVIVSTHAYLDSDTKGSKRLGEAAFRSYKTPGNTGEQMWEKVVSKHANIFMVLCGHIGGQGYQKSTGVHGNTVHEILADYQNDANGGNGFLRYLTFHPDQNRIDIHTYSPSLDQHNEGAESKFSIEYDMTVATPTPGAAQP